MPFKPYKCYDIFAIEVGEDRYLIQKQGPNDEDRHIVKDEGLANIQNVKEFSPSDDVLSTEELIARIAFVATGNKSARFFGKSKKEIEVNEEQIRNYGVDLGNFLFPPSEAVALDVTNKNQIIADEEGKNSYRTHVRLNLTHAPSLRKLNWESLIIHRGGGDIDYTLSVDENVPFSRVYSPNVHKKEFPDTIEKFRLLIIVSNPTSMPSVDGAQEVSNILNFLEGSQGGSDAKSNPFELEIIRAGESTNSKIRSTVDKFKPHIIHYIGHSGSDENGGFVCLHKEDDITKEERIHDDAFATLLQSDDLFLVILNSCQSANGDIDGMNSYSGLAQRLIKKNIPYVVAMQNLISVKSAITFSEGFYSSFFNNYSVIEAVTVGRRSIYASPSKLEYTTPVLYTINKPPRLKLRKNKIPVAIIKVDHELVTSGQKVTLNGKDSYDPDPDDKITYKWKYLGGPTESIIWCDEDYDTMVDPAFIAPETEHATTLKFRLTVNDGKDESEPAEITITVEPKPTPLQVPDINIEIMNSDSESFASKMVGYIMDWAIPLVGGTMLTGSFASYLLDNLNFIYIASVIASAVILAKIFRASSFNGPKWLKWLLFIIILIAVVLAGCFLFLLFTV